MMTEGLIILANTAALCGMNIWLGWRLNRQHREHMEQWELRDRAWEQMARMAMERSEEQETAARSVAAVLDRANELMSETNRHLSVLRTLTEVRNPDAVIPGRMPFKLPVGTRPISKEVKTFKHTDK